MDQEAMTNVSMLCFVLSTAAPAAGGWQCWCWTGLGSLLIRFRLVGVTGAPLAAAAVAPAALAPAAAVCVGGGANPPDPHQQRKLSLHQFRQRRHIVSEEP
eukprot:164459-Pelagomonas_calceolata.AAC.1